MLVSLPFWGCVVTLKDISGEISTISNWWCSCICYFVLREIYIWRLNLYKCWQSLVDSTPKLLFPFVFFLKPVYPFRKERFFDLRFSTPKSPKEWKSRVHPNWQDGTLSLRQPSSKETCWKYCNINEETTISKPFERTTLSQIPTMEIPTKMIWTLYRT